jgi:hypothetical protein
MLRRQPGGLASGALGSNRWVPTAGLSFFRTVFAAILLIFRDPDCCSSAPGAKTTMSNGIAKRIGPYRYADGALAEKAFGGGRSFTIVIAGGL